MADMKTFNKRVCNLCGSAGKVWDNKKWWCALDFFTSHGFCKNEKGTKNETSNS
jgi:hypothetical protein